MLIEVLFDRDYAMNVVSDRLVSRAAPEGIDAFDLAVIDWTRENSRAGRIRSCGRNVKETHTKTFDERL